MTVVWPLGLAEVLSSQRPAAAIHWADTAQLLARVFPPASR